MRVCILAYKHGFVYSAKSDVRYQACSLRCQMLFPQVLAKKMIAIMELSQQQLSKQDHYDYGLRSFVIPIARAAGNILSFATMCTCFCAPARIAHILVLSPHPHLCSALRCHNNEKCPLNRHMAGILAQLLNKMHVAGHHMDSVTLMAEKLQLLAGALKRVDQEVSEELIMYRTMLDLIKPKLVYLDLPLFMALLSDLFPGVEQPPTPAGALRVAIEADLIENNLQVLPATASLLHLGTAHTLVLVQ